MSDLAVPALHRSLTSEFFQFFFFNSSSITHHKQEISSLQSRTTTRTGSRIRAKQQTAINRNRRKKEGAAMGNSTSKFSLEKGNILRKKRPGTGGEREGVREGGEMGGCMWKGARHYKHTPHEQVLSTIDENSTAELGRLEGGDGDGEVKEEGGGKGEDWDGKKESFSKVRDFVRRSSLRRSGSIKEGKGKEVLAREGAVSRIGDRV